MRTYAKLNYFKSKLLWYLNWVLMQNWTAWNWTVLTCTLHTYAKRNCFEWIYFSMLNWIEWYKTDYPYKNGQSWYAIKSEQPPNQTPVKNHQLTLVWTTLKRVIHTHTHTHTHTYIYIYIPLYGYMQFSFRSRVFCIFYDCCNFTSSVKLSNISK